MRQLREDMDKMKQMGAPLEYNARERGWRYTRPFDISEPIPLSAEEIMQLRLAVATLAQVNQVPEFAGLSEVFEKIRKSVRRWLHQEATAKAIYFDPLPKYEGGKHLTFFLRAIEETRQVKFDYQAFRTEYPRPCLVDPYFLRRHNQRWYLGGFSHDPDELFVRTYPLERIVGQPEYSNTFFNRPVDLNPPDYWRYIVGINRPPNAKPERVVLEFTYLHGRYFLSKPFFEPFRLLEETPDKLVVEFELIVDIELIRRIAAYGAEVRVLFPISLADRIAAFFKEGLNQYKKRE